MKRLQYLHLTQNSIGSKGAEHLAESIISCGPDSPLKQLCLENCSIEGSGAKKFMTALKNCRHLERLDLRVNRIGSEGAECLAESITSWGPDSPLKDFFLTNCNIKGFGAEKLMESLQSCRRLKDLHMERNNIGTTGAKKLATSIKSWIPHSVLKLLCVESCSIDASGCIPLMEALASCGQLRTLRICNNPIGGAFEAVSPHLVYPRLEHIVTSDSSLTEGDIQNIATMINNKRLPLLKNLTLGYDKLTDGQFSGFEGKARFTEILKNENGKTFEAWRTMEKFIAPLKVVWLEQGNVLIQNTKELIQQEEERRKHSKS